MNENGARKECFSQGKIRVLTQESVPLWLSPTQIPPGLARDWSWASAVTEWHISKLWHSLLHESVFRHWHSSTFSLPVGNMDLIFSFFASLMYVITCMDPPPSYSFTWSITYTQQQNFTLTRYLPNKSLKELLLHSLYKMIGERWNPKDFESRHLTWSSRPAPCWRDWGASQMCQSGKLMPKSRCKLSTSQIKPTALRLQ
jgi:hypothetical protein